MYVMRTCLVGVHNVCREKQKCAKKFLPFSEYA